MSLIRGTFFRAGGTVDTILVQLELEDAEPGCQIHEEAEGAQ